MSAIANLKQGEILFSNSDTLSQLLRNAFADKGITQETLQYLLDPETTAYGLGQLTGQFMMRSPYEAASSVLQHGLLASFLREPRFTYTGTPLENKEIDESVADYSDRSGYRDRIERGAARYFSLQCFRLPPHRNILKQTPIMILGAGAAGILVARTLLNAGYQQIRVLDNRGVYGGIWNQPNVKDGSKNNPFSFNYEQFRVEAAPGPGHHITEFLAALANPPRAYELKALPAIHKANVLEVIPGDLTHCVRYRDKTGEYVVDAPIVINTLGIGKPLHPSREGVMTTDVPHLAGIRWQQIISPEEAKKLRGKTLVLIGLGNSTAEMLVQIQQYNRAGMDIRYKILTHYPPAALRYPFNTEKARNGEEYRLFRNTTLPQLTKLAGDLEQIERAFEQARNSEEEEREEIIPLVRHWTVEQHEQQGHKEMIVTLLSGKQRRFDFDQLYTLIGYGHPKEELESMGMWVLDEYLGAIAYDYDGEIQRVPGAYGRARVYPGYFALGSLLKSSENPNAFVIPGMLYRLPDLFASVVFRSAEYALQKRAKISSTSAKEKTQAERISPLLQVQEELSLV